MAKIGLLGGPASGKTTFIASLRIAMLQDDDGWKISGNDSLDPGSSEFINEQSRKLHQGILENKGSATPSTYSFTVSKPGGVFGLGGKSFVLTVHDRPGADFGITRHPNDPMWKDLASCDGLLFLFDPSNEGIDSSHAETLFGPSDLDEATAGNFQFLQVATDGLAALNHLDPKKSKKKLPQRLAVCMTKFDSPEIFSALLKADMIEPAPDEDNGWQVESLEDRPYVSTPEAAFELFADIEIRNTIKNHFDAAMIRYFVASSTGFYEANTGDGQRRILAHDPSNLRSLSERARCHVRPYDVLKPLFWLCNV